MLLADIGKPDANAAADRHNSNIPAFRERAGGESGGDIKELVLIVGADDAGMAKHRVIGIFGAGHAAGMG